MNDIPRQKLREIIAAYGTSVLDEPRRVEGLLRDLCGEYRAEISVLVGALRERVPNDLLSSAGAMPTQVMSAQLAKRLRDDLALSGEAANWGVESWVLALGLAVPTSPSSALPAAGGVAHGTPPAAPVQRSRKAGRWLLLAVPAAVLIVIGAILAVSGGGDSGGGGGGTTSMSNADLLKAAAANMKAAKSYHLDISGTAAGQAISMNGDIDVAGNKSSLAMSAAGQNISVVTIISDTYLSIDGGKTFTKSSDNSVTSGFTKMWDSFNPADIDKSASALKDASPPNDTIDGANTKHITANAQDISSLSSTAGSAMTGTVDIWVSTDANPTVRQMKLNGTSSGQSIDFTAKWSNFNSVPAITAPPTSN
jgi:LppX_LprAFG lipoprotein